ncbi:YCF48-related protein [Paenibacillus sp. IHBB 10380]|uniref:YCF48-related protein n=1 Tax=Paenibacillus sp. IHBB 10380 TaxID=1566358 RepID=UPI0005CFC43E|nr:YCF48-related protein [Paenibacillus sp. IHBB 10380]
MTIRQAYLWIIFLVSIILSSCSSPSSNIGANTTPEQVDDLGEQGQVLNVVTPDTITSKSDNVTKKYQIQTRLTDFHMINGTTGLAWGLTKNALRMYQTKDNGKSWINISPAANVKFGANIKYGSNVFFIDSQNGWIIRNAQGKTETVLLRTVNGGRNWKISSITGVENIVDIYFTSIDRGWIMTSTQTSMGKEEKALFHTDDGGDKWKKVMQNAGTKATANNMRESIPHRGYVMGMDFIDSTNGFITTKDLGIPKLYRTEDAGTTWSDESKFFDRNKFGNCSNYFTEGPQFFAGDSSKGWMSIGCTLGSSSKFNGYFTIDGGHSWEFTPFNLKWSKGVNQFLQPVFINENEGWILQDVSLFHTYNRGKSWSKLPRSPILEEQLAIHPVVVKLEFINSYMGWILLENSDTKRSLLLQTIDGGSSWKVL